MGALGTKMEKPWEGAKTLGCCGARCEDSKEPKGDAEGCQHIRGSRARADCEGLRELLKESGKEQAGS